MCSSSKLFWRAASVVGVWMLLFCGAGHSAPVKRDDHQCGGFGSEPEPVHCVKQLYSKLEDDFKDANTGNGDIYLQKIIIGNETAYAGSYTHIHEYYECVEELIVDYDSERFPQFVIQSTCKSSCKQTDKPLGVLQLNHSECDIKGREKYEELSDPVFLSLCKAKAEK